MSNNSSSSSSSNNSSNNNAITSDSNNNSTNKQVDVKRKAAEMKLSRRFLDVLTHHLEIVADAQDNKQKSISSSSFQLEPAERKILYEINNLGIVEGLVAGALTLLFLRKSRSYFQRTLVQRAQRERQGQQQQQQMFTSSSPSRSPFQQQQQQQQQPSLGQGVQGFPVPPPGFGPNAASSLGRIPMTMIGWFIDCLAAFTTTVAVSVAYTNVDEILQKVAELPLVEGHSVVARELCPPILYEIQKQTTLSLMQEQQLQQQQQQQQPTIISSRPAPAFDLSSSSRRSSDEDDMNNYNDNDNDLLSPRQLLQNPKTAQLGAIVKFAENCKRRQVMERSLRREKGIVTGGPVEIPTPGVPKDLEVDLFSCDNEQEEGGDQQQDDADAAAIAAAAFDFYNPNNSGTSDNNAWSDDSDQRRES